MMVVPLRIEPLSGRHNRSAFSSGSAALDQYFRERASQDMKRRITACFVAVSAETDEIAGFYTLTASSLALDALPPDITNKLPRYPLLPAVLLGRLAVAAKWQGQGIGSVLLSDALIRSSRAELGVFVMLVDAKDMAAQRFYEHFGFSLIPGEGRRLCLPIATAPCLLEGKVP